VVKLQAVRECATCGFAIFKGAVSISLNLGIVHPSLVVMVFGLVFFLGPVRVVFRKVIPTVEFLD
jgi:hypothetical protein